MFEIQVQGRFKRPPEGDLYISLEITDRMKLGLLAKVWSGRFRSSVFFFSVSSVSGWFDRLFGGCGRLFSVSFVGLVGVVGVLAS